MVARRCLCAYIYISIDRSIDLSICVSSVQRLKQLATACHVAAEQRALIRVPSRCNDVSTDDPACSRIGHRRPGAFEAACLSKRCEPHYCLNSCVSTADYHMLRLFATTYMTHCSLSCAVLCWLLQHILYVIDTFHVQTNSHTSLHIIVYSVPHVAHIADARLGTARGLSERPGLEALGTCGLWPLRGACMYSLLPPSRCC